MAQSTIEWTESTWNPLTGCTKISPGCKFCYAERMAKRLQAMNQARYMNGFKLTLHEDLLELPIYWKKPQLIFVNSMSGMFHRDVPAWFIQKTFDVMHRAWWHQFQVLTKRSDYLLELSPVRHLARECLDGCERGAAGLCLSHRPPSRDRGSGQVRFLGASAGAPPQARPARDRLGHRRGRIRSRSPADGGRLGPGNQGTMRKRPSSLFFKQWGGFNKKKAGRLLQGRTWDELPRGSYTRSGPLNRLPKSKAMMSSVR